MGYLLEKMVLLVWIMQGKNEIKGSNSSVF